MKPLLPLALAMIPLPAIAQIGDPPAPVFPPAGAQLPQPALIHYDRVALECDGAPTAPMRDVEPFHTVLWGMPIDAAKPQTFRFRIDETGRPLSIAAVGRGYPPYDLSDLMPSIAAMRFAAGPRKACNVTFKVVAVPLNSAPRRDLARAYALPHGDRTYDRRLWEALLPAGSTCTTTAPQPRVLHYPDFDTIPQAPGTASFVVLSYDIDAAGRTRHIRTVESDGNAALDRAGTAALGDSRFNDGQPRVGCVTHFYRRALAEGSVPTFDWKKPENADCKLGEWVRKPNTVFPANYGRRGVSGKAVLSFDVAPWGALGNIKVIASEPGSAFGEAARSALSSAMQAASSRGSTGCTRTFSFRWRDDGAATTAD